MIEYLDFVSNVDQNMSTKEARIWRQLTLPNGRAIALYAAAQEGKFGNLALHVFITYIKSAAPHDFERFSNECLNYALKATEMPAAKQLFSTCLVMPCIATHTTFRELVEAAESTVQFKRGKNLEVDNTVINRFQQTVIVPCLLNLTSHKSFFSTPGQDSTERTFKAAERFLNDTVISANTQTPPPTRHR